MKAVSPSSLRSIWNTISDLVVADRLARVIVSAGECEQWQVMTRGREVAVALQGL